ncbi:unnamed protein product [Protopolystoma xenopodis]|uniref:Uncharacterized protein n=1 Tax=Protopolystoma xenopodis TaxID=117903 RepID=A0A3S5FED6_9PLAT|nr:unnamed protein product [Protopolystoma xenopodis]
MPGWLGLESRRLELWRLFVQILSIVLCPAIMGLKLAVKRQSASHASVSSAMAATCNQTVCLTTCSRINKKLGEFTFHQTWNPSVTLGHKNEIEDSWTILCVSSPKLEIRVRFECRKKKKEFRFRSFFSTSTVSFTIRWTYKCRQSRG